MEDWSDVEDLDDVVIQEGECTVQLEPFRLVFDETGTNPYGDACTYMKTYMKYINDRRNSDDVLILYMKEQSIC